MECVSLQSNRKTRLQLVTTGEEVPVGSVAPLKTPDANRKLLLSAGTVKTEDYEEARK